MIDLQRDGDVFLMTMNDGENRWNTTFVRAFAAALKESGIQKAATIHTLRHSWGRPLGRLVNAS